MNEDNAPTNPEPETETKPPEKKASTGAINALTYKFQVIWNFIKTKIPEKQGRLRKVSFYALLAIFVWHVVMDLSLDKIELRPFNVPPALVEQGYSGQVVANRLRDHIKKIRISNSKDRSRFDLGMDTAGEKDEKKEINDKISASIVSSGESTHISIPGTSLSLEDVVAFVRLVLKQEPVIITGDIVLQDQSYLTTIRMSGKSPRTLSGKSDSLEIQITQGAEYIMSLSNPLALADYYLLNSRESETIKLIKQLKSSSSRKDQANAHLIEGKLLLNQRKYLQALKTTKKAGINNSDTSLSVQYKIQAFALEELGKNVEALKKYALAAEENPKDDSLYLRWGRYLLRLNKPEEARSILEKCLDLNPRSARAHYQLAKVFLKLNNKEEAQKSLKKAAGLAPEETRVGSKARQGLIELKQPDSKGEKE